MSSAESKPSKKAKVELDDAEDGMSLGSLLQDRRKKPSNVGSNSLSKLKKEELQGDDGLEKTPKVNSVSGSKSNKIKKEERFNHADDDYDDKPGKKSSVAKRDMELKKKKKVKEEEKKSKTSTAELESKKKERKEKKVYDLPGQKRDPPEERDPLRIFYETLYKQLPLSEMAQFCLKLRHTLNNYFAVPDLTVYKSKLKNRMMESGLLSKEQAKKVYEKKQKAPLQKISSPVKTVSAIKSVTKMATIKKKAPSSPVSSNKKTTVDSKVTAKQSKKRESEDESDDDFVISRSMKKKPRAA